MFQEVPGYLRLVAAGSLHSGWPSILLLLQLCFSPVCFGYVALVCALLLCTFSTIWSTIAGCCFRAIFFISFLSFDSFRTMCTKYYALNSCTIFCTIELSQQQNFTWGKRTQSITRGPVASPAPLRICITVLFSQVLNYFFISHEWKLEVHFENSVLQLNGRCECFCSFHDSSCTKSHESWLWRPLLNLRTNISYSAPCWNILQGYWVEISFKGSLAESH